MERIDRKYIFKDGAPKSEYDVIREIHDKLDEIVDGINKQEAPPTDEIDVLKIHENCTGKEYYCRTFEELNIYLKNHCEVDFWFTINPDRMSQSDYENMRKADHDHS